MIVDNVVVRADFNIGTLEAVNYVRHVKQRVKTPLESIEVHLCSDGKVDVKYGAHGAKFERIRRVTGYLTGDISSWNDAKQAEEHERVKHDVRL